MSSWHRSFSACRRPTSNTATNLDETDSADALSVLGHGATHQRKQLRQSRLGLACQLPQSGSWWQRAQHIYARELNNMFDECIDKRFLERATGFEPATSSLGS